MAAFEQAGMLRAKDTTELWLQILEMGQHKPSPLTAFDEYILMAPIVGCVVIKVVLISMRYCCVNWKRRVARAKAP